MKGCGKPIATITSRRVDMRGGHAFLGVFGPKWLRSVGGKEYILLAKYYSSTYSIVHFMLSKSEISKPFE